MNRPRSNRDSPSWRSSQIVGISATGRRSRVAFAVNSRPISKPVLDSMPTSRTKSVSYALKLLVASRVPTRANQVQSPARPPRQHPLEPRPADLLAAGHVTRRRRDHHTAVDQPGQVVDLPRIVTTVGHRHHRHRSPRRVDAEPDRVRRTTTVGC